MRRSLRAAAAGTLASALALAACSLSVDLTGLSSGEGPEAGPPGEGPPVDGAPPDAPTVARDGGGGGVGGEGGRDGACPEKLVALCEDFEGNETKNGWEVVQRSGGTAQVTTAPNGERGLSAIVPKVDTGDGPAAYWSKAFDKTVSKISVDLDLQYGPVPSSGEYHTTIMVRIDHGPTWNLAYFNVAAPPNGFAVQDFPVHADNIDYQLVDVSPNQPHHLHFDVEVGGRSRFAVDGVTQKDNPTPSFFQAGQPTLMVGVTGGTVPASGLALGCAHVVFTGE